MKPLAIGVGLAVLAAAGLPGQELPQWVIRLARVKQHARANFEHIPNYACLETVNRFEKPRNAGSFQQVDTLRLEVASVGGQELMAWEGAKQFSDEDPKVYSHGGLIGTGAFSATVLNLFVHDIARVTGSGEEKALGRAALRYDFEVSVIASGYVLQSGTHSATVGSHGTFWADAETLDLLRIEEHAADIPPVLGMRDVDTTINYARMRIGSSNPLLPTSAETVITDFFGGQKRNAIEFSGCREYGSESVIRFEGPMAAPPVAPKKK